MSNESFLYDVAGNPTSKKDPDAILDFTFNWAAYLLDIADTISTATVRTDIGSITINSSSVVGSTVVAWISGGTAGITYTITCKIVTAGGRTDERSFKLVCIER